MSYIAELMNEAVMSQGPPALTVGQLRREIGRELGMRKALYPGWVNTMKLTQQDADHQIKCMAALYFLLKKIEEGGKVSALETKKDRAREDRVAAQIASLKNGRMIDYGKFSPVDRVLIINDAPAALYEIKCRSCPHNAYDTVYMTIRKWVSLQLGALGLNVPAYHLWAFDDGIAGSFDCRNTVEGMRIEWTGRTDRDRQNDKEIMIHVPKEKIHWFDLETGTPRKDDVDDGPPEGFFDQHSGGEE